MRLLIPALFLALFSYGQDSSDYQPSGLVAYGVTYTVQSVDLKSGGNLTEVDTVQGNIQLIVSETQNFVEIHGVSKLDSIFEFDSVIVENIMENQYLEESLKMMRFTERRSFTFEVDYINDIIAGKMRPVMAKLMYDDNWNAVKLYAIFSHDGTNYIYNFFFDEVSYLDWKHGMTYTLEYPFISYGEMETETESETTVYEEKASGTLTVNDESMTIKSDKINLTKTIKRCFSTGEKNIYMVSGALCSIPRFGDWIFYSFDYDNERGAFDGYYYFELKEIE